MSRSFVFAAVSLTLMACASTPPRRDVNVVVTAAQPSLNQTAKLLRSYMLREIDGKPVVPGSTVSVVIDEVKRTSWVSAEVFTALQRLGVQIGGGTSADTGTPRLTPVTYMVPRYDNLVVVHARYSVADATGAVLRQGEIDASGTTIDGEGASYAGLRQDALRNAARLIATKTRP